MLPILALKMEDRGREAWGGSDGTHFTRHIGEISESWASAWEEDGVKEWKRGIFHTRQSTHGVAGDLANTHPFVFVKDNGHRVIGIHNGIIRNHAELNARHSRKFKVDSMHLWADRAEGVSWGEIEGYGALAWYESSPGSAQYLHFTRFNHTDLHIATLETGELVFSSTLVALKKATRLAGLTIKREYIIKEFYHYKCVEDEEGDHVLVELEKFPFASSTVAHNPVTSGHSGYSGFVGGSGDGYGAGYVASGRTALGPRRGGWKDAEGVRDCYECRLVNLGKTDKVFMCQKCLAKKIALNMYKVERVLGKSVPLTPPLTSTTPQGSQQGEVTL